MTAPGHGLLALVFAGALLAGAPAAAESLIATLSTVSVRISSNFTGTQLTVFGAVVRDAATISRGGDQDVVVVVRGPPQSVVTRRKERFFGIWVNRSSETFRDVPAFYVAHSRRPLDEVADDRLRDRFQIGVDHVALTRPGGLPAEPDFKAAFVRLKREAGLYGDYPGTVERPGETIFQTTIALPANVPTGRYTATVYLFNEGALLARTDRSFVISKVGFEQVATNFAQNQGLVYGIVCIALALAIGWLAGLIFRRD